MHIAYFLVTFLTGQPLSPRATFFGNRGGTGFKFDQSPQSRRIAAGICIVVAQSKTPGLAGMIWHGSCIQLSGSGVSP
ncbi:MAG: hypothetical protein K8H74_00635 [Notoacmeibacter sp.]|nr:hypothetical protein [Notoacmeibacter sp.]